MQFAHLVLVKFARLGSSGWPTGWPKYAKPAGTSWWLNVHSPLFCRFTSSIQLTNYYCETFLCRSFLVFLPLVFTVHHCLSQRLISRRGKHLGDTVELLLVAGVQQQQSLITPLILDPTKIGKVAETLKLITQLAGKEGGSWRPSGRPQQLHSAHWKHAFPLS